jgi:hypothetical protein
MTDYTKLVHDIRAIADELDCKYCGIKGISGGCKSCVLYDAADAIEALQAQVEDRTNAVELWNDMYLTKHLPQDEKDKILEYIRNAPIGPLEPMRIELLTKHGKWVEDTTTYAGPGLSNYKCSLCGKICGTWRSGLKPSELPNWCGNCGADMRKMEVQDESAGSL